MLDAQLEVLAGKHRGKTVALPLGKFLVGREKDCHLRAASDLISRHHCVFYVDEYVVRLRDLGSRNGTFVNGNRLQGETPLRDGDQLTVGSLEFRVVIRAAEAAKAGTVPAPTTLSDSEVLTTGETAYEVKLPNIEPAADSTSQPSAHTPHQAPEQPAPQYPAAGQPGMPPEYSGYPGGMPYYPQYGYPPGYPMYPYPMPGYPQQMPQQGPPEQDSKTKKVEAPPIKLPPPPERSNA